MRLDKFLKASRAIKRRSWAKEACEAGAVQINGRIGKAHTELQQGDCLEINLDGKDRIIKVEIYSIPEKGNLNPEDYNLVKTWIK